MNIYELAKRLEIITVEDVERYTITELIYMICNKLNNTTMTLKDLIEIGLSEAVAEQLTKWIEDGTLEQELSDLVLKIPYRDYDRNEVGIGYGKYDKTYEGFSQFTKKTYGRYEQGTVVSIVANTDEPMPQITGTDTKGLATYTSRDSCALYVENTGGQAPLIIPSNQVTYHANDCVIPSNTNMSQFKVGMILDTEGTVNVDWYVGIIKEIRGTTLVLEDGWYLVRNDGVTPTKGVPSNGLALRVSKNTKVWNINSNLFINQGCSGGCNMELGVLCNHTDINDVGGIDLINMGSASTHYGIKVRHKPYNGGFNEAYMSDSNGIHFSAWTQQQYAKTTDLLRSMQNETNSELFSIKTNGLISGLKVNWEVISETRMIGGLTSVAIVNAGCTVKLQGFDGGRIVTLIVLTPDTVLLQAEKGSGVKTFSAQGQEVNISKGTATHRAITLFNDGGYWYVIADNVEG